VASIGIMKDEQVVSRARRLGEEVLGPGLRELQERHPSVGEVRGLGCFWALDLVRDRDTREPLVPFNAVGNAAAPMAQLLAACKERHVWPFTHFNRLHVVPPCTTSDDDARLGLRAIDEALAVTDGYVTA
jgi:taurine--2-oxoglutarate transaminase